MSRDKYLSAPLEDNCVSIMAASAVGDDNSALNLCETVEASKHYSEKIALIGGCDPYSIKKNDLSDDINVYPGITYLDIVNYLLFTQSAYKSDELRNYKSLAAYNQFVSGWIREIHCKVFKKLGKTLVIAKVMHSQRLNGTPLKPWVICETEGKILACHCNCMAGLGESCSHVGAILFDVDAVKRMRENKTVTQEKRTGCFLVEERKVCMVQ